MFCHTSRLRYSFLIKRFFKTFSLILVHASPVSVMPWGIFKLCKWNKVYLKYTWYLYNWYLHPWMYLHWYFVNTEYYLLLLDREIILIWKKVLYNQCLSNWYYQNNFLYSENYFVICWNLTLFPPKKLTKAKKLFEWCKIKFKTFCQYRVNSNNSATSDQSTDFCVEILVSSQNSLISSGWMVLLAGRSALTPIKIWSKKCTVT